MQYNATININPYDYINKDDMADNIMTSLEGYHPDVGDLPDFPNLFDVVVTIDADSLIEAIAKTVNLVCSFGAQVGVEVIPTNLWDKREGNDA